MYSHKITKKTNKSLTRNFANTALNLHLRTCQSSLTGTGQYLEKLISTFPESGLNNFYSG